MLYLGADHGGFKLKEELKAWLNEHGIEFEDLGNSKYDDQDDYPTFAKAVADKVAKMPIEHKGILLCRTGVGVSLVADKFYGVKSVLGFADEQVKKARGDEDVNVLSIASDYTSFDELKKRVKIFLETPFSGEDRHRRRLSLIEELEDNNLKEVKSCQCANCQRH